MIQQTEQAEQIKKRQTLLRDLRDYIIDSSEYLDEGRAMDLLRRLDFFKYEIPYLENV